MPTAVRAPIVLDDPGIACIEGTTARVREIARVRQASGFTPEELQAELPHLTLAQVYAALAYYHQHREALDAEIEAEFQHVEKLRLEAGESPFARRMRAAGQLR